MEFVAPYGELRRDLAPLSVRHTGTHALRSAGLGARVQKGRALALSSAGAVGQGPVWPTSRSHTHPATHPTLPPTPPPLAQPEEAFWLCSGETRDSLKVGRRVEARVRSVGDSDARCVLPDLNGLEAVLEKNQVRGGVCGWGCGGACVCARVNGWDGWVHQQMASPAQPSPAQVTPACSPSTLAHLLPAARTQPRQVSATAGQDLAGSSVRDFLQPNATVTARVIEVLAGEWLVKLSTRSDVLNNELKWEHEHLGNRDK